MVCWRWRLWALMLAVGALPALALAATPTAADFEAAATKDLPGLRDDILKAAPSSSTARDAYGKKVADDFTAANLGINSKRPEVRLNTAILIHDLGTLSTDKALMLMLQNDDAAVRYWGAKGLGDISTRLKQVGPTTAIRALREAGVKPESSGIVAQELIKALVKFNDFPALLDVMNAVSGQMETSIPDVSTLQSAALGLESIAPGVPNALATDKVKAATVAARFASFAAQQQINNEKAIKAIETTAALPEGYTAAVQKVVDAAVLVIDGAAGKPHKRPQGLDSGELMLNVNKVFGTPGGAGGDIQGEIKSVPVPPAVKVGG